jgi:hypothetical protein
VSTPSATTARVGTPDLAPPAGAAVLPRSGERVLALGPGEMRGTDAAPRVQVTIGRLEIRASAERSEPPPKAAPTPPAMSLEDYLAKREKA